MKSFKVINSKYICEECGKELNSLKALSIHIQFNHNKKEYTGSKEEIKKTSLHFPLW